MDLVFLLPGYDTVLQRLKDALLDLKKQQLHAVSLSQISVMKRFAAYLSNQWSWPFLFLSAKGMLI